MLCPSEGCAPLKDASRFDALRILVSENSIWRTQGQHSQCHLTVMASLFAPGAVGLQSQINIQVRYLCAIVVFARSHIRQRKIGTREPRVTEERLSRAFFCFVRPVELHKCFAQNYIALRCDILYFQTFPDDFNFSSVVQSTSS